MVEKFGVERLGVPKCFYPKSFYHTLSPICWRSPMFKLLFRFSIRDVLWLMVVIGLALGWWVDRRGIQQERDIWKYHAEGGSFLSLVNAKEIEFDGKDVTAKHPRSGTF